MIVFPLRRSVRLKAATASSRLETLPMFVRSRPSRTRWTSSLNWARSGTTTKSIVRPPEGRASVGPSMVTSVPPARITPADRFAMSPPRTSKTRSTRRHLLGRRYRGRRTPVRRSREPSDGRQRARWPSVDQSVDQSCRTAFESLILPRRRVQFWTDVDQRKRKELNGMFMSLPIKVRHLTLFSLCLMAFILYIDRVNISVAGPFMKKEMGLSPTQLGVIFSAFAYSYAFMQIPGGWLADKFGPRLSLVLLSALWSVATVMSGVATGVP